MDAARHVIAVHHAPLVVEAMDLALSALGFTVHPAATYRQASLLLEAWAANLGAVIAHADMPTEPMPGTFLLMARETSPKLALVVLSGRALHDIGPLPPGAVLLREPFDRAELVRAIVNASDPRRVPVLAALA